MSSLVFVQFICLHTDRIYVRRTELTPLECETGIDQINVLSVV